MAMTRNVPPPPMGFAKLAERLQEGGKIDNAQYEAAVTHQRQYGMRIEEALIEVQAIGEAELLKFLATHYRTRFVSTEKLAKAEVDRLTLDKVPRKFAEQHQIFPVLYDPSQQALSVVTPDPDNLEALRELQMVSSVREVRAFVARPYAVKAAIAKSYAGDIHAFAALDRQAHQQFSSMLNVYERNLISDEEMARSLADANMRERNLDESSLAKPAGGGKGGGSVGGGPTTTSDAYLETVNVLVSLLENGRAELRGHSGHVARITKRLCERVGIAKVEVNALTAAAYLHDLGKHGAYHLTALNVAEYEGHRVAAEKAVATPRRLMDGCSLTDATVTAMETMYERYDGDGFPGRMSGKDIPLGGRILAIADTYADLTQNPRNPFRKALRPAEACEVLGKHKGTVFDPNLVDLFRLAMTGDDLKTRLLGDRSVAVLIDNDPEETTILELRLIQQGFLVKIARTVDVAFKLLETEGADVVVSELDLQPQDGFALLAEVRKSEWGKEIPWVILTRRQGRDDALRAYDYGVADFMAKPTNPDLLGAKLKQIVQSRITKAGPRGVSGSLGEMALPDIVQVLWHGRKSGSLRIRSKNETGEIHFVEGNIWNALWGRLRGEEAFYAMLTITEGDFALAPQFRAQQRVIESSPEQLLLEGMRRLDEAERA